MCPYWFFFQLMLHFIYMIKRRIYLDYASLTPIDPRVIREVTLYSSDKYANPSSLYSEGVAAKKALQDARNIVADFIHAHSDEITFTSGGTEANNIAIIGTIQALRAQGVPYEAMHVVISAIEHSSVRECANFLNEYDVSFDVVAVDAHGVVDLADLKNKIQKNTVIVSVMTVNNEIGSVQPIREIAKIVRNARKQYAEQSPFNFQLCQYPIFHTDAAQAPLYEELNVEKLGVDLLTLDSSKIYGPRGIGALYIKRNTPIANVTHGGGQEAGMRPGTENIPAIMGFAKALTIAAVERESEVVRIGKLREYFIKQIQTVREGVKVNGAGMHIVNVSIPRIDNEFFVIQLNVQGIACSTKSSCLRDEDESYVLKSIGADSLTSVRFSFGRWSKKGDIDATIKAIKKVLF